MQTQPYWDFSKLPRFASISSDISVDVVIVGGGLTGITAAYLLKKEGVKVALLERRRCAEGDTGRTTAHLTYVTDMLLSELARNFGKEAAKAYWEGGQAAIDTISSIVGNERIDCDFKWVPGYLHSSLENENSNEKDALTREAALAEELGFSPRYVETVPCANRPGILFKHQAKFDPAAYLAHLLSLIHGDGSFVFENTEAEKFEADPMAVRSGKFKIHCSYVFIATHNPILGRSSVAAGTLFQTKLALYTSYVLGGSIPKGQIPEALFWDTSEPYFYLRADSRKNDDYVIFGGKDCKTGQEKDPGAAFTDLEKRVKGLLPDIAIEHRWLGQVVETNDGFPFIGENEARQFIATGFCGNGFTLGTLSALMVRDRFLERKNPWYDLFAVDRKKFHGGTWRYIKENLDYPYYFLRDHLKGAEGHSISDVKIGEGKILKLDGRKVAAYRDESGKVHLLSPVCTHLKCIVRWNGADGTWDCPCHGSRFLPKGDVLSGPAEDPLPSIQN